VWDGKVPTPGVAFMLSPARNIAIKTINQMATKHSVTNTRTIVLLHKLRLLHPSHTIHAECSV